MYTVSLVQSSENRETNTTRDSWAVVVHMRGPGQSRAKANFVESEGQKHLVICISMHSAGYLPNLEENLHWKALPLTLTGYEPDDSVLLCTQISAEWFNIHKITVERYF